MIYWLYQGLARLPLAVLYPLAHSVSWLLQHVIRYRRRVVDNNLARAFPHKTQAERDHIRRRFYRHLTEATVEIIAGSRWPLRAFTERVTMRNPELLEELSEGYTRSVVVLTLHQGNWEWMLHRARDQYPTGHAFVYKRLHSESADRFSLEARTRFGAAAIEMRDAARNLVRHRRETRLIFMVADQSPGRRERVHWTEFLNQPTAFFSGAAALARATGYPVAFARCRRMGRGRYAIELEEITRTPKTVTDSDIIEAYARLAEEAICDAPEDWLWSNRRWKLTPDQPSADNPSTDTSAESKSSQSNPKS